MPSSIIENYTYRNNKDLTFQNVSEAWGLNQKSLSNGAAYADLDNDGDLDLVVNNIDQKAFVYRNNSEKLLINNFIKVKLKGKTGNTFGIGSRVEVVTPSFKVSQEQMPVRGFQSSMDYVLVFGVGNHKKITQLKITWPDGTEQIIKDVTTNQTVTLSQIEATNTQVLPKTLEPTFFVKMPQDSSINYKHTENNYNDFKRERLLPHKLSTEGPKIAKGDVDGDGLEDLFIIGAKGSEGLLYKQLSSGGFIPMYQNCFLEDLDLEDMGALFFDADNDGDLDLYVVSGGNEFDENDVRLQDRLYLNNGKGHFKKTFGKLPEMLSSGSCVITSDFDNDGDLDLFVGGRLVPGKYPTAPKSYLLENDGNGNFTVVTKKMCPSLEYAGMVTAAVFADVNNDQKQDLIIVGEWMPIRIFLNQKGTFE